MMKVIIKKWEFSAGAATLEKCYTFREFQFNLHYFHPVSFQKMAFKETATSLEELRKKVNKHVIPFQTHLNPTLKGLQEMLQTVVDYLENESGNEDLEGLHSLRLEREHYHFLQEDNARLKEEKKSLEEEVVRLSELLEFAVKKLEESLDKLQKL